MTNLFKLGNVWGDYVDNITVECLSGTNHFLPVLWNEGKILAPQTPLGFTHVCAVIRSQNIPDYFVWC